MDMMSLRRRVMVNQNKLMTATGNPITFHTPLDKPLKECVVRFTPKQEGSGTPSPDNVREISGRSSVKLWQSGKNLVPNDDPLNPTATYAHTSTGSVAYDATEGAYHSIGAGVGYFGQAVKDGNSSKMFIAPTDMTVTVSLEYKDVGTTYGLRFHKSGVRQVDIYNHSGEWTTFRRTFDLVKGDYFSIMAYSNIYWRNVQVEVGSEFTGYEPYIAPNEITFSWDDAPQDVDSSKVAGTIYGGYVDTSKGELVAEKDALVFDGSEAWGMSRHDENTCVYLYAPGRKPLNQDEICSHFVQHSYASGAGHPNTFVWGSASGYVYIQVPTTLASDVTAFKQFLADEAQKGTPVTIVANPLAPIHYSLTPQSIATLRGENVMWSDANGDITVRYWTR